MANEIDTDFHKAAVLGRAVSGADGERVGVAVAAVMELSPKKTDDYVPTTAQMASVDAMWRQCLADWDGSFAATRDNDQPSYAAHTKALARHWRLLRALVNEEAK